jgi:hypothetical protein
MTSSCCQLATEAFEFRPRCSRFLCEGLLVGKKCGKVRFKCKLGNGHLLTNFKSGDIFSE